MVLRYNNKGSQGIGTLIIFIALILVAAVAAGVLIQTASSLQSKSLDVGRQSQQKITTDVEITQIYTTNTSDGFINGSIDNFTVVVRLGSGSNPVKLSDMLIMFDTTLGSQTMTLGTTSETTYSVRYVLNGTSHLSGYLVEGDLAAFEFTLENGTDIGEAVATTTRLVARNGAIKPVDTTTPAAMVNEVTHLYP